MPQDAAWGHMAYNDSEAFAGTSQVGSPDPEEFFHSFPERIDINQSAIAI